MNYLKKTLFSLLVILSVSNYSIFSMELSKPTRKKIEKVSASFANKVFDRLKVDFSNTLRRDNELLESLQNSEDIKNMFADSFVSMIEFHMINNTGWKENNNTGILDRKHISDEIKKEFFVVFEDEIHMAELDRLLLDGNYKNFKLDVQRVANEELKKFIKYPRKPFCSCSCITKIVAGLLLLESCHLLVSFKEPTALIGVSIVAGLWFGFSSGVSKSKK